MLKKSVNEAYCRVQITTTGPLLVRSGQATISGPDLTPVLTLRNGKREIFLPGSSLKGVFRSHIEKIVCSLKSQVVCYPFTPQDEQEKQRLKQQSDFRESCGGYFNDLSKRNEDLRKKVEDRTDLVYKASCPTCRLFGSTGFIGRIAIGDAHLVSTSQTEFRDGVGIDRMTGGASHGAKFELEVVSTGVTFETDIHIRNFEIWQLGMFFVVLQDLQDGLIHIGSGRSRGLGKVTAQIYQESYNGQPGGFVTSTLRDSQEKPNELWGLGRWLNDNSYGTSKENDLLKNIPEIKKQPRSIRSLRAFQGENLQKLQAASIDHFVERMQQWPTQQALTAELAGTR